MYIHLPKTRTTTTLKGIPDGKAGTLTVLKAMRELARKGKSNPNVFDLSRHIVKNVRPKDWAGEVSAVFRWVRDNIRYVKDPHNLETLHTPQKILEYGQGDCDDQSILLATLLETIGHPARFVAVGFAPGTFSHVYVETKIGNRWIPLDATMEKFNPGQKANNIQNYLRVNV
jgi:transglutaminase-like putative cysteine protease